METTISSWARNFDIKPNGVIHVGASIGEERDEWAALTKRVAWIEPHPGLLAALRANVEPLGGEVIAKAAGEKQGTAALHIASNLHSSSLLPLGRHALYYPDITYEDFAQVEMDTLDHMFEGRYDQYDYLYMDVQGYEGQVLLGAEKLLPHIKWIYAEFNHEEMYTGCWLTPKLRAYLLERHFVLTAIELLHSAWGNALFIRTPSDGRGPSVPQ